MLKRRWREAGQSKQSYYCNNHMSVLTASQGMPGGTPTIGFKSEIEPEALPQLSEQTLVAVSCQQTSPMMLKLNLDTGDAFGLLIQALFALPHTWQPDHN